MNETTEEPEGVLLRLSDLIVMRERFAALTTERGAIEAEYKALKRRLEAAEFLLKCQEQEDE